MTRAEKTDAAIFPWRSNGTKLYPFFRITRFTLGPIFQINSAAARSLSAVVGKPPISSA